MEKGGGGAPMGQGEAHTQPLLYAIPYSSVGNQLVRPVCVRSVGGPAGAWRIIRQAVH